MKIRKLLCTAVLVAAALALATASLASSGATPRKGSEGAQMIAVGADPIKFELVKLGADAPVKLDDLLGKKAVMMVFWSLFCGPCQEELPIVNKVGEKYREQGLEVYAINLDGEKRAKAVSKYMDKQGFSFDVLWEKIDGISYVTADAYGVQGTPTTILIGKDGKVSYTHVGQATIEEVEVEVKKALGM